MGICGRVGTQRGAMGTIGQAEQASRGCLVCQHSRWDGRAFWFSGSQMGLKAVSGDGPGSSAVVWENVSG